MKKVYRNVTIDGDKITGEYNMRAKLAGDFQMLGDEVERVSWVSFSASRNLLRIDEAISRSNEAGERIWAESDGYGEPGFIPIQGFDWSGIRDSSDEAKVRMEEIAKEYVSDDDLSELLGVKVVT